MGAIANSKSQRMNCWTPAKTVGYNQNMTQYITAIYEHGVLKPLGPLELREHEVVSLVLSTANDASSNSWVDDESQEAAVSWEQVRAALSELPGSLSEEFSRERDERS
jgi:predicted DNA-binding antitoxin AbrB/MazE fold protein